MESNAMTERERIVTDLAVSHLALAFEMKGMKPRHASRVAAQIVTAAKHAAGPSMTRDDLLTAFSTL